MKLKSYILTGVIITLTITSFFIGRSYESYKLKALEVSNVSSNEEIDNKNKESNKEELSEEQLRIKKIILSDKDGLFKVVNKENSIDKSYKPEELIIPKVNFVGLENEPRNRVSNVLKKDLENLFSDAKKAGLDLYLSCAYRSYEEQEYLYGRALEKEKSDSSNLVALPGTSEHQLGLAVDLTTRSIGFQLEESFEDTKEGQWLLENSHKYGFILRYLKGKEDITGYSYEPWHYRYVGDLEVSKYCYDNNLTLEELYDELDITK
ncbi:M15 family metallopeptidase [Clostridium perfringens]|uniref:M15 family metallopeptidase n=1 Tax=Clostridium perfringens TaxID=1502 RepID=UPI0039EBC08F